MSYLQHPLVSLSYLMPKIQRRMPFRLGECGCWGHLEELCYTRGVMSGRNVRKLQEAQVECQSPSDWFDFASRVFPSHQQKKEILSFLDLAAIREPRVVMEIGTAQSGTQFLLGQVLNRVEVVLAVDLRVRNRRLLEAFSRDALARTCLEGSSYDPATVRRVEQALAGRPIDVLFIDGDHTYEGVKKDHDAYRHLVRPGGLIAFHDIVEDHQTRFGRSSGGWAGEVPHYWREVKASAGDAQVWEFIADPEQDGMGIGVVQNLVQAERLKG